MNVTVIVASAVATTGCVITVNDAIVLPAAITTEDGTPAAGGLLEVKLICVSTAAGALSVTVPVAPAPPVTLDGATFSDNTETVAIVSTPRPS